MNRFRSLPGALLVTSLTLAACSTPLVVAPHAIPCAADDRLLAQQCPPPTPMADDATFEALVDAARGDRQALRECGISLAALRDSLHRCQQAVDDFNRKIDEINARNKRAGN